MNNKEWDQYFHDICVSVAKNSPCLSRKIGAILVHDKSIISTGYNGPARGIPHCGRDRFLKDKLLSSIIHTKVFEELYSPSDINTTCPRRLLGYVSGEGMQYCHAQHAEENCISNAARLGVSTIGTTLYMNCVIPCRDCFSSLINAGVKEIVVDDTIYFDKHSPFVVENSNIKIRKFKL